MLKLLFLLIVALLIVAGPFAALRQPWAVTLWRRLKLVLVVYIVVRVAVTVVDLVLHGGDIYG